MDTKENQETGLMDPHPNLTHVGDLPGNMLRIRIKEEVMTAADVDDEQSMSRTPGELLLQSDPHPDWNDCSRYDPSVLADMKIELDVAEDYDVQSKDGDMWRGGRSISDSVCVFSVQNPAVMDIKTEAEITETPPHPPRTDPHLSIFATASASERKVIPGVCDEPRVDGCIGDTMQCGSSVGRMVLKANESDAEPWCVIKAEPVTESDSDTDTETRQFTENGARAVFNHEKGGRSNLELFISTHDGEKRYYCPEPGCGKSYKRGEHLKIHALVHTGDRPYQCPEPSCGKSFAHPFVLKEHIRIHSNEKPFLCPESNCGRCFRDRSNLRKHLQIHTGDKPKRRRKPPKLPLKKPYLCPQPDCDRAFSRPSVLQDHLKRHLGDKPFRCTEPGCGKAFLKNAALIMHMRIHTGERPFSCVEPGCGKSFARSDHLKDHMVTHTGQKPFRCSEPGCERSFTQNIQLTYHTRTHSGVKPYRCTEAGCNKSYTQNKHLRYHMRSHSGIQPFPCPEPDCERAFDRPSLLTKHAKSYHGKNIVNLAEYCGQSKKNNSGHHRECIGDACGENMRDSIEHLGESATTKINSVQHRKRSSRRDNVRRTRASCEREDTRDTSEHCGNSVGDNCEHNGKSAKDNSEDHGGRDHSECHGGNTGEKSEPRVENTGDSS